MASSAKFPGGCGPSLVSSTSQRVGSLGGVLAQACSESQRPFSRKEYRPTTATGLPSYKGSWLRISHTVMGMTGASAQLPENAAKMPNRDTSFPDPDITEE